MLLAAHMSVTVSERLSDQIANVSNAMRSKDNVDIVKIGKQALSVALGNTATNGDNAFARRCRRKALARKALPIEPCISSLAHTARHKDNDIGFFGSSHFKAATRIQKTAHALRIVHVHLAAKCANNVRFTGKNGSRHTLPNLLNVIKSIGKI